MLGSFIIVSYLSLLSALLILSDSNTSYLTTAMIDDREGLLNQTEQEYYVNKSGYDI